MRHLTILILLCAVALATFSSEVVAKKVKARHLPRRETGQIACTIEGCHRIPPECHPEMGYDINGIPTGFDIVVCLAPRRR